MICKRKGVKNKKMKKNKISEICDKSSKRHRDIEKLSVSKNDHFWQLSKSVVGLHCDDEENINVE
jgi:hypothetical protein